MRKTALFLQAFYKKGQMFFQSVCHIQQADFSLWFQYSVHSFCSCTNSADYFVIFNIGHRNTLTYILMSMSIPALKETVNLSSYMPLRPEGTSTLWETILSWPLWFPVLYGRGSSSVPLCHHPFCLHHLPQSGLRQCSVKDKCKSSFHRRSKRNRAVAPAHPPSQIDIPPKHGILQVIADFPLTKAS